MLQQAPSPSPGPARSEEPAETSALHGVRVWSSTVLSIFILGLGVWTAIWTARIVSNTYIAVIYWDDWDFISELRTFNGVMSLKRLWAQHNEHRILIGRLAALADIRFFHAGRISMLIEIYLVQLSVVLLFTWLCYRLGKIRGVALVSLAGFCSYCMFCPIQMESLNWGVQITYVLPALAAAVSFACVLWHAIKVSARKANWISGPLLLAFVAAFIAECGLAYGVFVWPVIVLLGYALRLPIRTLALSSGVGLIAIALYLIGYVSPTYHTNPWESIRHPLSIAKFVTTYLAFTWDSTLPSFSFWPTVSESMTVLALALVIGYALWMILIRPPAPDLLRLFLVSNLILTVLTAVITSLGRMSFGLAQATASRYQSIALVFWASLAGLLVSFIVKAKPGSFLFVGIQIVLAVLMVGTAGRFAAIEMNAKQHQIDVVGAYAALAYDPPDPHALKALYPAPQMVPILYAYARAHNLGPDARVFLSRAPRPLKALPNWGSYHVVDKAKCSGYLDAIQRIAPDRVSAQGWAWDIAANRAPQKIVMALPSGTIIGFGNVDTSRPDVQAIKTFVSSALTGWNGEALAPKGSQVRAFAVLEDSASICPLPNEVAAP